MFLRDLRAPAHLVDHELRVEEHSDALDPAAAGELASIRARYSTWVLNFRHVLLGQLTTEGRRRLLGSSALSPGGAPQRERGTVCLRGVCGVESALSDSWP